MKPLLENNTLCRAMGLTETEVLAALLDLDRFRKKNSMRGADVENSIIPPTCPHCKEGYEVVDIREGHMVCSECGAVTSGAMNVQPEYQQPPEMSTCTSSDIPGVPKYLLLKDAPIDHSKHHWDDLEHWNAYANLSQDALQGSQRILTRWKEGCHTIQCRLAAVLLEPLIIPCIPNEEDVRWALRKGTDLPQPRDPIPSVRFFCEQCGTGTHTAKDARFHCRTGGAYGASKRRRL